MDNDILQVANHAACHARLHDKRKGNVMGGMPSLEHLMSVIASASHFPKNGKHFDGAWPLGPKVNIAMIRRGANITRASLPGTAPLVGLRPTTSGLSLFFAKTEHTEAKHADREASHL
jgi:hypothetical protein